MEKSLQNKRNNLGACRETNKNVGRWKKNTIWNFKTLTVSQKTIFILTSDDFDPKRKLNPEIVNELKNNEKQKQKVDLGKSLIKYRKNTTDFTKFKTIYPKWCYKNKNDKQ